MADDPGKQSGSMWDRLRRKAGDAVARQSAGLVRGRTAAHDVFDDAGNLLVGAGRPIDDAVIERSTEAGKMPAIVAAAAAAQGQDLRERLQGEYDGTPEGQGRRSMDDSEAYIEARQYIRYTAAVEVTDIRGNVIVRAGSVIQDDDVRAVREAGQLAALIYSAQQSGPPTSGHQPAVREEPTAAPRSRRTAVPLSETYDQDDTQEPPR